MNNAAQGSVRSLATSPVCPGVGLPAAALHRPSGQNRQENRWTPGIPCILAYNRKPPKSIPQVRAADPGTAGRGTHPSPGSHWHRPR